MATSVPSIGNEEEVPDASNATLPKEEGFIRLNTHDTAFVEDHISTIEKFAEDLQDAVNAVWPCRNTKSRYTEVYVILISWEDNNLGVEKELKRLGQVFSNLYRFEVHEFKIPRKSPGLATISQLSTFLLKAGPECLLIVYYGGHTRLSQQTNEPPIWTATDKPGSPTMPSGGVQQLVEETELDVLLLYDSCHSSHPAVSVSGQGVTEVIAACGFETQAPVVGPHSFTNALIKILEESFINAPFSVADLHSRVIGHLKNWKPALLRDINGDVWRDENGCPKYECYKRRTPVHCFLTNETPCRSIMLGPLAQKTPIAELSDSSASSTTSIANLDSMEASEATISTAPTEAGDSTEKTKSLQILLAVRLEEDYFLEDDDENKKLRTWCEWLRNIPSAANSVKIQGVYKSCSTLLLLSMPIVFWDLLPANAAYSFIGFVASSNLAAGMLANDETEITQAVAGSVSPDKNASMSALQAEVDRLKPLEKAVKEKNDLIEKLRHEAIVLNDNFRKALKFLKKTKLDDTIDRQIVTNHFLNFVTLDRSDPKKLQVLQLIAALLKWTDEQKEQAGLIRLDTRLSVSSIYEPPATKESLADLWTKFLERESRDSSSWYNTSRTGSTSGWSTGTYVNDDLANIGETEETYPPSRSKFTPIEKPRDYISLTGIDSPVKTDGSLESGSKRVSGDVTRAKFTEKERRSNVKADYDENVYIFSVIPPEAAVPYCVAKVYIGELIIELKRKPIGKDFEGGRELITLDQDGNTRFRHRIKTSRNERCYPHTWYRRWRNDRDPLEVGFTGTTPQAHSIFFKGGPVFNGTPKYIFTKRQDFNDFQSEVRGKHLEGIFDVRRISSGAWVDNRDATDQQMTIWRDHVTREFSISFYADNLPKPGFIEFPLAVFGEEVEQNGTAVEIQMRLSKAQSKRARTVSKVFIPEDSSPDDASSSSSEQTPKLTNPNTSTSGLEFETTLESLARNMKYVRMVFCDDEEATKFRTTYAKFYEEEHLLFAEFYSNWAPQRCQDIVEEHPRTEEQKGGTERLLAGG